MTLGDLANCAAVTRIGLEPLSLPAVATLAAGSGLNAEQLHDITGGNPFFVTEVLAAGPDALTGKACRAASPRRCAVGWRGCPPRRGRLRTRSRCAGRAPTSPCWRRCVREARTALNECLDAGVLIAEGDLVGFRHELARRATLAQIPDFDRTELHRRALSVLAQPPIDANTLAALAFHADEADDGEAAVRHGIAAAERSASLGANREAANRMRSRCATPTPFPTNNGSSGSSGTPSRVT